MISYLPCSLLLECEQYKSTWWMVGPQMLNCWKTYDPLFCGKHRHEVVVRRTTFELKKAEDRAHILEGLIIALTI